MKKILIASTALVAAGLLTTGTASASEKIKLNLGGFSKWWVVGAWQDSDYEAIGTGGAQGASTNVDVKGDTEIFFGGETTLDNGLTVGVNIELEAGGSNVNSGNAQSTAGSTTSDTIDKSSVFISGGFGKIIAGTEANGTVLLHVMAPDAAANWGSENMVFNAIAQPTNASTRLTTEIDTDDNADKITYVAPTFYGLTIGGSFIPNALSEDDARVSANMGSTAGVPAYGVGALYANTFGGVDVKLSGGYVTYDASGTGTAGGSTYEWSTGTQLSYAGFTLGGSYRHITAPTAVGDSIISLSDGRVWDAGLQYASGPYAVSFTYFDAKQDGLSTVNGDNETELYQVSGKYALGAGVDLLATVGHVEYSSESTAAADNNKGWTAMTGLSLAF